MGNVANSLKWLLQTTDNLRKAEAKCEYDRGYFLHREYAAVESAEKAFIDAIREELKEPSQ